jgi:hypothetical protein
MEVAAMMNTRRQWFTLLGLAMVFWAAGCKTVYYSTWEKLGKYKRDLLKDNVQEARKDQEKATETFKDALTRLKEMYGFQGGDLEKVYNKLKSDFDRCNDRATAVKGRIAKVETVANDLFMEWENELKSMSSERLQSSSRDKLRETRAKYETLHAAMKRAERSMEPVLGQFRDQVLYLKHNLNAQAVGSLKGETAGIETEVQQLIRDMNASIAEADAFIKGLP